MIVCALHQRRGGLDIQCPAGAPRGSETVLPAKPLSSIASQSLNKTSLAMAVFWRGLSAIAKLMGSGITSLGRRTPDQPGR